MVEREEREEKRTTSESAEIERADPDPRFSSLDYSPRGWSLLRFRKSPNLSY